VDGLAGSLLIAARAARGEHGLPHRQVTNHDGRHVVRVAYREAVVDVPIIASGGAGKVQDFIDLFEQTGVTGALAASIFHFGEIKIPDLKNELRARGITVR